MKLYRTTNYYENPVFLGQFETEQERAKAMYADIESRGEKSYYVRFWIDEEGRKVMDYGSYSIFYIEINDNDELK